MNIERVKFLDRVKIAYLRHRGSAPEVAKELGIEVGYVYRLVSKIKKQESRDVKVLISNTLMGYMFLGHQSRLQYLMEMLKSLENREQLYLSTCCNGLVERTPGEAEYTSKTSYTCMTCRQLTDRALQDRGEIYELKMALIEELREEDASLLNFAEKMGYTHMPPPPEPLQVNKVEQNILVLGGKDLTEGDRQTIKELQQLRPMDRERVRKKLEKSILEEGEASGEEKV